MVLTNAERQARYRKKLKEAAQAARLPTLKEMKANVKAMPDGPEKERLMARIEELREAEAALKELRQAIRRAEGGQA